MSDVVNIDSKSYAYNFIDNAQIDARTKAQASKAAGGSVLMALAIAMGLIADKMTDRVFALAEKLDNIQNEKAKMENNGKSPGSMSENLITAQLQAQTQIMNMFMQAMSTVIKSYGEANTQVARKSG
ncbi:hypothetical protein [Luteimonas suaedae]|uniref:hypothetical protein n=1 Tax=Luteimonas suaedae TaxID=2605430 RepID=UPI0011EE61BF|nr:hypothetical protein [Luteimonas suaedae]